MHKSKKSETTKLLDSKSFKWTVLSEAMYCSDHLNSPFEISDLVLGSAGAASAQTHRHAGWQAPYANSYNQDTRNLRYGHANDPQFDPLAGTVFDGVAPY